MSVESDVLARIRPTEEERAHITKAAHDLYEEVQTYIDGEGIDAEIRFVGSFSKDTFLSDPDLDLFVLFPTTVSRDEMERIGLKIGDDILHGYRMFTEHPYTRGSYEGVDVDLVPCFHLKDASRIQSSVDRSPFHTRFVLQTMSLEQRDQVRLLKKFMKGIGAYGAEPDVRGFSGYLCELLILRYRDFAGVMQAAAEKWRGGMSLRLKEAGPPMDAAMVFYDPVDCRRNVASAVHLDTLSLVITAAKDYIAAPSEKFFFPAERAPLDRDALAAKADARGTRIVTAEFLRPDDVDENVGSQLWKTQYALIRKLDDFGFGVLRAVHGDGGEKLTIAFELERDTLPDMTRRRGPPVWVRASERFLGKWEDSEPFIEDGAWNVIVKRRYTSAGDMLARETAVAGIGREMDPETMRIRDHEESLAEADRETLTELLCPTFPWKNRTGRMVLDNKNKKTGSPPLRADRPGIDPINRGRGRL